MTLTERRKETARFTAWVNDPQSRAWPNDRLAIRVAEKNLALAEELNGLCLQLMRAYRSAMRGYASAECPDTAIDFMFNDKLAGEEIMKRVTKRGHDALAKAFGPHPLFADWGTTTQMTTPSEQQEPRAPHETNLESLEDK